MEESMYANPRFAKTIVTEMTKLAYELVLPRIGRIEAKQKEHPTHYDVVTEVDRDYEHGLDNFFYHLDPQIGFRGEEYGNVRDGEIYIIADPIDGTSDLARGLPH